jgi:hypothetical protein
MPELFFGPLIGLPDVETAILDTLRAWLPTYLSELERQKGLQPRSLGRPPAADSYHGGDDFDSWEEDSTPEVIVVCEPTGEAERTAAGVFQWYEVQVGCVLIADDEDIARNQAGHWGTASMLLAQQGSLGGFAQETVIVGSPKVEFPNPDERRLARAVATFHVWVGPIIDPNAGPIGPNPPGSPGYGGDPEAPFGDAPTVESSDVTVVAEPLDE